MIRHAKAFVAVAALTLLLAIFGAPTALAQNPPTATVTGSEEVGITSARLKGEVNPEGEAGSLPTFFHFEVSADNGSDEPDGNWIFVNGNPDGEIDGSQAEEANPIAVEGIAENLQPTTKYFIRLVADNADFQNHTETQAPYLSFETKAATAPELSVQAATDIGYTTATLNGKVDPKGGNVNPIGGPLPINWQFEYRIEGEASWSVAPCTEVSCELSGSDAESPSPIDVKAEPPFGTLQSGKNYEFRLFAFYLNFSKSVESARLAFQTKSPEPPPTATIEPVASITGTTATFKGLITPNAPGPEPQDPAFDVDWRFQCNPACPGSLKGTVAADDADHQVEVEASGLTPHTTYKVSLIAENEGAQEVNGGTEEFTTDAIAPAIKSTFVSEVTSSNATLNAKVNPGGAATTYHFEYVTAQQFDQDEFAQASSTPEASLGSDASEHLASANLNGLDPDAVYRFRVVATNEKAPGGVVGPAGAFHTSSLPAEAQNCSNSGPGVGILPHCRAWEMVSPPDKNGGDVLAKAVRTHAALTGGAITFASLQGFADTRGMSVAAEYLSERDGTPGTSGWSTHAITPRQQPMTFVDNYPLAAEPKYEWEMSADLTKGVFLALSPLTADPNVANALNLYLRDDLRTPGAGSYQLVSGCPLCEETNSPFPPSIFNKSPFPGGGRPWLAAASEDFGHVIFESWLRLTKDATPGNRNLYESDHGTVHLVGILPSGAPAPSSKAGAGVVIDSAPRFTTHPISSDGSRIAFTVGEEGVGSLYQRINHATTIPLNLSERAVPDSPQPARYWDQATDGSRVFFTTTEVLTEDASGGGGKLYMWAKQPTDEEQSVAIDAAGGNFTLSFNGQSTAQIDFDASASEVLSALEALVSVKPGNVTVSGGPGSPGAPTPYEVTFTGDFAGANVADLEVDGSSLTGGGLIPASVATTHPVHNLTYLSTDPNGPDLGSGVKGVIGSSDDGHYVYFVSNKIRPQDPLPPGAIGGIYLWHDGAISYVGRLARFDFDELKLYDGADWGREGPKQSRVTPDGRHLLFRSSSGLGLLSAHGGTDYDHGDNNANELYLYGADTDQLQCASCNPTGAPATASASDDTHIPEDAAQMTSNLSNPLSEDGHYVFFSTAERLVPEDTNGQEDAYVYDTVAEEPRLISSGRSSSRSLFMEASADGTDAFFVTREQLSGWDVDASVDLYDARIGGGFPEPPPPPPSCQGDACQPAPLNLNDPTPASSSFKGPGDKSQGRKPKTRCAKGKRQVKRRGKTRCVKRTNKRDANANRRASR